MPLSGGLATYQTMVVNGLKLGALALVGFWLFNLVYLELSNNRSLGKNAQRATGTLAFSLGAGAGLITTGVLTIGQFIDAITLGIANHPFAVSNLAAMGLGLVGINGAISGGTYLVATTTFIGATIILTEVRG